jgi:hypothetical protein
MRHDERNEQQQRAEPNMTGGGIGPPQQAQAQHSKTVMIIPW